jgi:hypothetical protein
MDGVHVLGDRLVGQPSHRAAGVTHSMVLAVQLPPLGFWAALERLCLSIAWRSGSISGRGCVAPVVADGAHAKGALGHGRGGRVALVLRDAAMVPGLGGARLLRVQCRGERVDLTFELGDAAVGLLLALSRGRRGDAWAPCLCAPLARDIGALLVAAHLQPTARVACAGPLAVARRFGRARRCVRAACTSASVKERHGTRRTHRDRPRRPHARRSRRATPQAPSATSARGRDPAQRPAGQAARDAGAAGAQTRPGSRGGRRCAAGARPCMSGAEAATRRRVGGRLGPPSRLLSLCIGGSVFVRPARVCPAVEI